MRPTQSREIAALTTRELLSGNRVDPVVDCDSLLRKIGPIIPPGPWHHSTMAKAPEPPPIHVIRRQRVGLDHDLAKLYGVQPKLSTRRSKEIASASQAISRFRLITRKL